MRPFGRAAVALTLLSWSVCSCREVFHLSTGFDIAASSHKQTGDRIQLETESGTIELPAAQVSGFDVFPDPPPPLVKSVAPARIFTNPVDVLKQAAYQEGTAPEFSRLVRSVALIESGLHVDAVSPKGAVGLMQLMPGTAHDLGVEPADIHQNARGGAHFLAQLLERYKNNAVLALAAYNAGPAAVDKYRGIPPFRETQDYVRRVLRVYQTLGDAELASSVARLTR